MEAKAGKRIVSKGAYLQVQISKYWGWFHVIGSFVCCIVLFYIVVSRTGHHLGLTHFISKLILISAGCIMYHVGKFHLARTLAIKPVVPLTRANTADLPAPDSLVRASEEPMQAQEGVLLRGAEAGQETPPEQLVRASMGGQE